MVERAVLKPARPVLGAILGALVLLVIGLILVGGSHGNGSAADPGLRTSARRLLPRLNAAHRRLPIEDSSLRSFQAWVYDVQPVFTRVARKLSNKQFAQVQFEDPLPMPPQAPLLGTPAHATVFVPSDEVVGAAQSGPRFTTANNLRVYLTPLRAPQVFQGTGVIAVLEVFSTS